MRRLFFLGLALSLSVPAYPSVAAQHLGWRDPAYQIPLRIRPPVKIRHDAYGSGLFGAPRSGGRRHRGIDLVAPVGTPVLAAQSGRALIGRIKNGMGRYIEIRHPNGWVTRYGHLKRITIRDRQRIVQGAVVGTVGKSGNARRKRIEPHLHFEVIRPDGTPINPLTVTETAVQTARGPYGSRNGKSPS